jgi:hypothetical protein
MDRASRRHRWAILLLWGIHGLSSYLFLNTRGLAYRDLDAPSGISFVRDLQSSGSDDGIAIEMGLVFAAVGVLLRAARWSRPPSGTELALHWVLIALQGLFLLSLEMGSLWRTVLVAHNLPLAIWLADLAALTAVIAALCWAMLRPRPPEEPRTPTESSSR